MILTVRPGAGGDDAKDWASMLLRMYVRHAKRSGLEASVLDESPTQATIRVAGNSLAGEAGVHRLVRKSAYSGRRETSFAQVEVTDEAPADERIDVLDIEFEAKTSRGHGGQSVNTTYSAIRATHKPTGITVTIQNERSQAQNKDQAIKVLEARVAELHAKRKMGERADRHAKAARPDFGSPSRTYVLYPYEMVRDHKTGLKSPAVREILDGDLTRIIK